jgi:AcrR family transcriptional regulator
VGERRRAGTATKGDQREQAILTAAEEQLATTGPDGITVESLTRAVGITRGAFYFYFGSKDDVLAALVSRTTATLTGEVAAAETIADPATALRRAVDHTAQQWYDHGRLLRLAVDLSPTVPEIDNQWRNAIAHTVTATTAIALRAGLLDDHGPTGARAVTITLVWMTERAFYQAATTGAPAIPEVAATCTAVWLRALGLA